MVLGCKHCKDVKLLQSYLEIIHDHKLLMGYPMELDELFLKFTWKRILARIVNRKKLKVEQLWGSWLIKIGDTSVGKGKLSIKIGQGSVIIFLYTWILIMIKVEFLIRRNNAMGKTVCLESTAFRCFIYLAHIIHFTKSRWITSMKCKKWNSRSIK